MSKIHYGIFLRKISDKGEPNMKDLQTQIQNYLIYCCAQKCLDKKTLKTSLLHIRKTQSRVL